MLDRHLHPLAFSKAQSPLTYQFSVCGQVLILNLKSANLLGITVTLPLLGRADEVIE